jgi:hypothetical protein
MYQKITQKESSKKIDYCKIVEKEKSLESLNPEKVTLAFIMQFACAYHVEKDLPLPLSGMILN